MRRPRTLRIASFNVENLFDRARALNLETWAEGKPVLQKHARINRLLNKRVYSAADKTTIKELLIEFGLENRDDGGQWVILRQNRGRLVKRPRAGGLEIVANGRDDWIGWVELKTEPVNELAMEHTAMVMRDVNADVLGVVEAETRIALDKFSEQMLEKVNGTPYAHVMVIDGNDDRGIDVGVVTRVGYDIVGIRSHVDDVDDVGEIFSRDCPEYTITTPTGARLVVLVNHLKSKGFGTAADSNAQRERQAKGIKQIYERLVAGGEENIVVLGDLNDTPASSPLAPLLGQTDLKDISTHPAFTDDGRPGTFRNGTKSQKIDYVLLSPALFGRVLGGAVFRTGVWGGKNGTLWPHYQTMTKAIHAASDHAAIYADINL
jgi:endonuclease/exonuclease/phosphatase family metal-dependent hydrolase